MATYSLWLSPAGDGHVFTKLRELIEDLSKVYDTPIFQPHVTLIGDLKGTENDIVAKAAHVAKHILRYEIKLGDIGSNHIYFQMLFAKVEQTSEVMSAYEIARQVFGHESKTYFPHLSLAYGDLKPSMVEKLAQQAREKQIPDTIFTVFGIEVWETGTEVGEWQRVAYVPLG